MNVKIFSWAALVVALAIEGWAQPYPIGIRSQAMGGTGVAHSSDAEAIFANPALCATLPGASATIFYSRPFGLREVNLASLAASARIAGLGCGLAVIDFGNEIYHDQYFHLAAARAFGKDSPLALALALQARHLSIRGYGSATALGLNLGTAFRIDEKLRCGIHLANLNQAALGAAKEKMKPVVCAGTAFSPREGWTLLLDYYRELGFDGELRFGVETRVLPLLVVRLGAASNPDRFSAGFAIELSRVALQAAANTHSDLGTTQFYAVSIGRR
jgi:hypothetical protein